MSNFQKYKVFIETGLNVFEDNYIHKIKLIKKYISLINIRNLINDDKIKNIYINNFNKRYSLKQNKNSNNDDKIPNFFVYILVSNSEYYSFTLRFMDKKSYKNDSIGEFEKINDEKEFILHAYVNFAKVIHSNIGISFEIMRLKREMKKIL